MIHELTCTPDYFWAVAGNRKNFEIRFNDRDFQVGDWLRLRCWDGEYLGNELLRRVTYVLRDFAGLAPGYVALGLTGA